VRRGTEACARSGGAVAKVPVVVRDGAIVPCDGGEGNLQSGRAGGWIGTHGHGGSVAGCELIRADVHGRARYARIAAQIELIRQQIHRAVWVQLGDAQDTERAVVATRAGHLNNPLSRGEPNCVEGRLAMLGLVAGGMGRQSSGIQ